MLMVGKIAQLERGGFGVVIVVSFGALLGYLYNCTQVTGGGESVGWRLGRFFSSKTSICRGDGTKAAPIAPALIGEKPRAPAMSADWTGYQNRNRRRIVTMESLGRQQLNPIEI